MMSMNKGMNEGKAPSFLFSGLFLSLIYSLSLSANESVHPSHFDIVEIQEKSEEIFWDEKSSLSFKNLSSTSREGLNEVRAVLAILDEVIVFGTKVVALVEKGKPVVNLSYEPISVMPKVENEVGTINWNPSLTHWSPRPRTLRKSVIFKNTFGAKVVEFTYLVNFSYGGQYNSRGAYLDSVRIVPEKVKVLWGFKFNSNVEFVSARNLSSELDPIAAATLTLNYEVSSLTTSILMKKNYQVDGRGGLIEM